MEDSESISYEEDDKSLDSDDLEKMEVKLEQDDRLVRIDQEYKLAKSDLFLSNKGCSIGRNENNKDVIKATIIGPKNSPFYGGFYKLAINFTENYPASAPLVKFETKIFHPNVYDDGKICIAIINNWKSDYSIVHILSAIYILLENPYEGSPANEEAGTMIKNDKKLEKEGKPNPHTYEKKASEWNSKYAFPV